MAKTLVGSGQTVPKIIPKMAAAISMVKGFSLNRQVSRKHARNIPTEYKSFTAFPMIMIKAAPIKPTESKRRCLKIWINYPSLRNLR